MSADEINPETDADDNPIWAVDGYLDFDGNYHDWQNEDWREMGDDWYAEADLVTISWIDADDGSIQHARLEGNFYDMEELEDNVDTYFEEGS